MTRIAPVRLMYNPKTLWFDAGDLDIEKDQPVVVTTARGTEYGTLAEPIFEMTEDEVKQLKNALKPVKRLGTEEDEAQAQEMHRLSLEAMPVFREMAAEENEAMRPISVEYLLDGDKAIFYFESEERIDFRDLVRKLASHFHVRVDMRQIGVRDEARMIGGLGHCGQELCCKRLGGEFNPVTIKMAKEQDLSLNPAKISGVCGRLMCCLRYEYEAYKDFHARAPKANATIQTPAGPARITNLDALREIISLRTEDGKEAKIPLADMEAAEEGARPSIVGEEAWEKATAPVISAWTASSLLRTDQFTQEDKLGGTTAVRRTTTAKAPSADNAGEPGTTTVRKRRRRKASQAAGKQDEAAAKQPTGKQAGTKQVDGKQAPGKKAASQKGGKQNGGKQGDKQDTGVRKENTLKPRPGQKSSELRRQQEERKADEAAAPRKRRRSRSKADDAAKAGASNAREAKRPTDDATAAQGKPATFGKAAVQGRAAGGEGSATASERGAAQKQSPQAKRSPRRRTSVNLRTGRQDGNEAE